MKSIGAFVVAAIGGYLIAAVMVSWVNMQSIVDLGFEITFAQRVDTITHDVMSLGMNWTSDFCRVNNSCFRDIDKPDVLP